MTPALHTTVYVGIAKNNKTASIVALLDILLILCIYYLVLYPF